MNLKTFDRDPLRDTRRSPGTTKVYLPDRPDHPGNQPPGAVPAEHRGRPVRLRGTALERAGQAVWSAVHPGGGGGGLQHCLAEGVLPGRPAAGRLFLGGLFSAEAFQREAREEAGRSAPGGVGDVCLFRQEQVQLPLVLISMTKSHPSPSGSLLTSAAFFLGCQRVVHVRHHARHGGVDLAGRFQGIHGADDLSPLHCRCRAAEAPRRRCPRAPPARNPISRRGRASRPPGPRCGPSCTGA